MGNGLALRCGQTVERTWHMPKDTPPHHAQRMVFPAVAGEVFVPMPRLRRADCSGPGIRRRRRGKGFEYLDADDRKVDEPEVLERIDQLRIPPGWKDVWICAHPFGHIQATGVDAAGRKQYLYHQRWRERRDQEKFDEMIEFARALPRMRATVAKHLAHDGMSRERVLACAVRLLDRGFFRVGGEDYAVENESYGLATMRKEHVTVARSGAITFDYPAKSGQRRIQSLVDPDVCDVVLRLKRRRGGGDELLAYLDGKRWRDVKSPDINEYVKDVTGSGFSAKDFRTWNATVLAAVALAVSGQASQTKTGLKRAETRAVKEVARYLGNTPAVCRASYIDPRVFDRFRDGLTIGGVLPDLMTDVEADNASLQGAVEDAVVDLIAEDVRSPALEKVA
jgi:DNA topoisomerase I